MKKAFKIALLVLSGLTETILPGSANATAIMKVNHDAFDIDGYTIWGELQEDLDTGYHEPLVGKIEDARLTGSLLSEVSTEYVVFSGTNIAVTTTRISSRIREDSVFVNLHANLGIGPNAITGKDGYGYSKSTWSLAFDIVGDGAIFTNFYSDDIGGTWQDYTKTVLFDMTSGLVYEGYIDFISLLDGHTYALFGESVQHNTGRDEPTDLVLAFENVHLKVPEPNTVTLLIAGLAGLGFTRKLKRR